MVQYCFLIATSLGKGSISAQRMALIDELISRGHKVIVVTTSKRFESSSPDANPTVYIWPSKRPTRWQDFRFALRLIVLHRPDYVLADFGAVNVTLLTGWLMRVPRRIVWYHTVLSALAIKPQNTYQSLVNRAFVWRKQLVYALGTEIIAVSEGTKDDLLDLFSVNTPIHVFHNTLIDNFAESLSTSASTVTPHTMVAVGRLESHKGHDVLLRALGLLKARDIPFSITFCGDGSNLDNLIKLARDLGIEENCHFAGLLPIEEVYKTISLTGFMVHPSTADSFPMVILEAMSLARAVIGSRVGGIPEIIVDGYNGFLVPPDDAEALADRIAYLLENPETATQLGRQAREHFMEHFESKKAIPELATWFESLQKK